MIDFVSSKIVRALSGLILLAVLPFSVRLATASAEGRVEIRVEDVAGKLTPARAWIVAGARQLFAPAEASATPYAKDRSFSFDGEFSMPVPAGPAIVHVEKGKEFLPVELNINVVAGTTVRETVTLRRWINMPGEDWYSADLHVHLGHDSPRVLAQLALADDVHLVPAFTYWLRGSEDEWKSSWPDAEFNEPVRLDAQHLITRNNIEIERINYTASPGGTIGATFLFNLTRPVSTDRFGEHYPTDATLCRRARLDSPNAVYDSDKPSWAETVIGAALGQLDTIQLCHNHYYRLSTGPGGWGMMGPITVGESNAAVGDGLFHRTNSLYYRFLNCGFRLGVSGGSAVGVKAMPTGHHRVYAKIDGELTAKKMWSALRAGRSFATTGPMLSLSANGCKIGDTLHVTADNSTPIQVRTQVRSVDQLESLQVIHNGRVHASRNLTKESAEALHDIELTTAVTPRRSGWIVSRALYRAPDGLLRQAHTSPIYITVDDHPTAFAQDARYMLTWIEHLAETARQSEDRFPDAGARNTVLATYAEAGAVYEEIAENAVQVWHDN